jgi:hypothetical protein
MVCGTLTDSDSGGIVEPIATVLLVPRVQRTAPAAASSEHPLQLPDRLPIRRFKAKPCPRMVSANELEVLDSGAHRPDHPDSRFVAALCGVTA